MTQGGAVGIAEARVRILWGGNFAGRRRRLPVPAAQLHRRRQGLRAEPGSKGDVLPPMAADRRTLHGGVPTARATQACAAASRSGAC